MFVVGIVWAIGRRYIQRPYRIRIKTKPEDAVILGTFLVIGVTGFLTEGFRIALAGRPSFEEWSFVGYQVARSRRRLSPGTLSDLHRSMWVLALRRVRGVPRDPADHEAAAHGHLADEHVPARPRAARRARCARSRTSWRPSSTPSARRRSRTSRGSSCSTPTRARSAGAARRCVRRTRPASRSTRARSC